MDTKAGGVFALPLEFLQAARLYRREGVFLPIPRLEAGQSHASSGDYDLFHCLALR